MVGKRWGGTLRTKVYLGTLTTTTFSLLLPRGHLRPPASRLSQCQTHCFSTEAGSDLQTVQGGGLQF